MTQPCEVCGGTGVVKIRVPMDPIGPGGEDAFRKRKCRSCSGANDMQVPLKECGMVPEALWPKKPAAP
jgi:hypothetical protein